MALASDTMAIHVRAVQGSYPMVVGAGRSTDSLFVSLDFEQAFGSDPSVELFTANGDIGYYGLQQDGDTSLATSKMSLTV